MGNQPSSNAGPVSTPSPNEFTTLPDSFFTEKKVTQTPPSYSDFDRLSLITDADISDRTRIVVRSSDSEHFSLSRRDVDAHTDTLIPADWSPGNMIDLTERSRVLEILFQFIGPRQHPRLSNEDFDFLAEVARAAEKYKVFSAMNTCSERMRLYGDRHPKLVLLYAAHHGYPHIIDQCAQRVVTSENIEYFVPLLPDHLRIPWLRYHAKWCKALTEVTCYSYIPSDAWGWSRCWRDCGQSIFQALGTGIHSLNEPSLVFVDRVKGHIDSCKQCDELCKKWRAHAEGVIGNIAVFSEVYEEAEPPPQVA